MLGDAWRCLKILGNCWGIIEYSWRWLGDALKKFENAWECLEMAGDS